MTKFIIFQNSLASPNSPLKKANVWDPHLTSAPSPSPELPHHLLGAHCPFPGAHRLPWPWFLRCPMVRSMCLSIHQFLGSRGKACHFPTSRPSHPACSTENTVKPLEHVHLPSQRSTSKTSNVYSQPGNEPWGGDRGGWGWREQAIRKPHHLLLLLRRPKGQRQDVRSPV